MGTLGGGGGVVCGDMGEMGELGWIQGRGGFWGWLRGAQRDTTGQNCRLAVRKDDLSTDRGRRQQQCMVGLGSHLYSAID